MASCQGAWPPAPGPTRTTGQGIDRGLARARPASRSGIVEARIGPDGMGRRQVHQTAGRQKEQGNHERVAHLSGDRDGTPGRDSYRVRADHGVRRGHRRLFRGAAGTAIMDTARYVMYRRAGGTDSPPAWGPVDSWEKAPDPGQAVKRLIEGFTQRKNPGPLGLAHQHRRALGLRIGGGSVRRSRRVPAPAAGPLRAAFRRCGLGRRLRGPAGGRAVPADLGV